MGKKERLRVVKRHFFGIVCVDEGRKHSKMSLAFGTCVPYYSAWAIPPHPRACSELTGLFGRRLGLVRGPRYNAAE